MVQGPFIPASVLGCVYIVYTRYVGDTPNSHDPSFGALPGLHTNKAEEEEIYLGVG